MIFIRTKCLWHLSYWYVVNNYVIATPNMLNLIVRLHVPTKLYILYLTQSPCLFYDVHMLYTCPVWCDKYCIFLRLTSWLELKDKYQDCKIVIGVGFFSLH